MASKPTRLLKLSNQDGCTSDRAFVVFASPESRCLGAAHLIDAYRARVVCVLRITDEENERRQQNIAELRSLCQDVGEVAEIPMRHSDPVFGIGQLVQVLREVGDSTGPITIDISTFPRNALLLTLRALDLTGQLGLVRLIYTEPGQYVTKHLGAGLCQVGTVPTYAAPYRADQEMTLVLFLGFERDRALGLWESVEPHETIAVIGRPAYHPEWEGRAEHINAALLSGLPAENIQYVDPRNPVDSYLLLKGLIVEGGRREEHNFYVAPLGTKPETVGLAYYWLRHPRTSTVVYAPPLERHREYMSEETGPTWLLPGMEELPCDNV